MSLLLRANHVYLRTILLGLFFLTKADVVVVQQKCNLYIQRMGTETDVADVSNLYVLECISAVSD